MHTGAHLPRLAQSELRAHGAYLHARESLDGSTVVGWCACSRWLEPLLHGSREARLEPLLRASSCSVDACSIRACCVRALLPGWLRVSGVSTWPLRGLPGFQALE